MDQSGALRNVAKIKLDEATRKRIVAELGIPDKLDWIPDTIHFTRVHAKDIGVKVTRPGAWILVTD